MDLEDTFDPFSEESPDISQYDPEVQEASERRVKAIYEGASRLPPQDLTPDILRFGREWRFSEVPQDPRWKKIRADLPRILLPENILSKWDALVKSNNPLLLTGPTGAGKDAIAELVHESGKRKGKKFKKIGAAELGGNLLASRLFGWERNSHAKAENAEPGLIRYCDGGTLVLDDIDSVEDVQRILLTYMDDNNVQSISPRGDAYSVDVRLVATTNADYTDGSVVRSDLCQRFGRPWPIPPLCDRVPADVGMLLQEYLKRNNLFKTISIRFLLRAMAHPWPGNNRELKKYCDDIEMFASSTGDFGGVLDDEKFPDYVLQHAYVDRSLARADYQVVLSGILYDSLTNKNGIQIACGSVEMANSLLLLFHLAANSKSEKGYLLHPSLIPVHRLENPSSFPKCYKVLPGLEDANKEHDSITVIEFLARIVRLARNGTYQASATADPQMLGKWLDWFDRYPRVMVPDHLAMSKAPQSRAFVNHPEEAESSSHETTQRPAVTPSRTNRNPGHRRVGRPGALTEEKLVEILQWADDEKQAGRFTENKLRQKVRDETGKAVCAKHNALSERVRRMRDLQLKGRAEELIRSIFGSLA